MGHAKRRPGAALTVAVLALLAAPAIERATAAAQTSTASLDRSPQERACSCTARVSQASTAADSSRRHSRSLSKSHSTVHVGALGLLGLRLGLLGLLADDVVLPLSLWYRSDSGDVICRLPRLGTQGARRGQAGHCVDAAVAGHRLLLAGRASLQRGASTAPDTGSRERHRPKAAMRDCSRARADLGADHVAVQELACSAASREVTLQRVDGRGLRLPVADIALQSCCAAAARRALVEATVAATVALLRVGALRSLRLNWYSLAISRIACLCSKAAAVGHPHWLDSHLGNAAAANQAAFQGAATAQARHRRPLLLQERCMKGGLLLDVVVPHAVGLLLHCLLLPRLHQRRHLGLRADVVLLWRLQARSTATVTYVELQRELLELDRRELREAVGEGRELRPGQLRECLPPGSRLSCHDALPSVDPRAGALKPAQG